MAEFKDLIARLTARDWEVLSDLHAACDNYARIGLHRYVRPLDCGGRNGSDHSYRLQKLWRCGFAFRRKDGIQLEPGDKKRRVKGSDRYWITEAGTAALKARQAAQ